MLELDNFRHPRLLYYHRLHINYCLSFIYLFHLHHFDFLFIVVLDSQTDYIVCPYHVSIVIVHPLKFRYQSKYTIHLTVEGGNMKSNTRITSKPVLQLLYVLELH